jgi:hypothetical protein
MEIPRQNSERHAYIIISTDGNLPSAARDAISHGIAWSRRGFKLHYYLDTSAIQQATIGSKLTEAKITASISADIKELASELKTHSEAKSPIDIIVAISSHGYVTNPQSSAKDEFIKFKGRQIVNDTLLGWFTPLKGKAHIRCVVFIDTCHSGTMCNFPGTVADNAKLPKDVTVCSISACSVQQFDMDDISVQFGFGGGLTSALMDALGVKTTHSLNIDDIFNAIRTRMKIANIHPQLYWL